MTLHRLDDVIAELGIDMTDEDTCHCGLPVTFGFDGNPNHTRGLCEHCDGVRCDAYPGACRDGYQGHWG